jgi:hypothetical protein
MRALSKSKLMALRQCPRRLWLEIHHPELRQDESLTQARFAIGDLVGELARGLYDPEDNGVLIDVPGDGPDAGVRRTRDLLERRVPIFEAGLEGGGARAFVDVLRPVRRGAQRSWELIEVKSSASLKASHRDDVAIQAYVAHASGLPLAAVKLAHVDTGFVYPGHDDYHGLLREIDLTAEVLARQGEVAGWVAQGAAVAARSDMPELLTGSQCRTPHPCGFLRHCRALEPAVEYPISLLPRLQGELRRRIEAQGMRDLRELGEQDLSPLQRKVRQHTLDGTLFFDQAGAQADLGGLPGPHAFLDFEAVQLAVPIWPGTRPYQMFPFQFSLHVRRAAAALEHHEYIDLSGAEPGRAFAEALVQACPATGAVLVWNASFELARIAELAARFPDLAARLQSIHGRVLDLLKVAEARYYHPAQRGSWKLKRVLPTLSSDLDHARLAGVRDGHMAMLAYVEAIQPDTAAPRRGQLRAELLEYCRLDTLALVHIHDFLSGTP